MKQKNAYAVITGASSGIGREFAFRLADMGYPLVLIARREEALCHLAERLPVNSIVVAEDLTSDSGMDVLAKVLKGKQIAFFINNAGFGDCGIFTETDLLKETAMIDLNIKTLHILTKFALTRLKKQGKGVLLNVASSAGLCPAGPYMATYYATKAYVTSLTSAISEELREEGSNIYVGCLCPGPVDTEFNQVANVEFALPGITAAACVDAAMKGIRRRQTVIVPTLRMKLAMTMGRFIPRNLMIRIIAHQQKKKRYEVG